MLLVKNYGDPLSRSGRARVSPFAPHVGKIITVFTSGAPPFTGLLIEAGPSHITLVTGIDIKRRKTGPRLYIAADKITAVSERI